LKTLKTSLLYQKDICIRLPNSTSSDKRNQPPTRGNKTKCKKKKKKNQKQKNKTDFRIIRAEKCGTIYTSSAIDFAGCSG
jgi:hypothetical protein